MESTTLQQDPVTPPHPRVLGWVGTAALAMGGSNQMIFLITALFVGQGVILGQGSAAPVAHCRGSARLGRGTCLDRARPDVAEPGRRNLGGLRRSLPALQPGARGADRHLLLVGLGADLRLDRSALCLSLPALVLPRASGRSCGHHHRLLFQLRELWPIDCSMPWQSHSRCAASKSPLGSASAARSIPKTRPTSMR